MLDKPADREPHMELKVTLQISQSSLTSCQEPSFSEEDTAFLPSLHVFNAASLAKPHAEPQTHRL